MEEQVKEKVSNSVGENGFEILWLTNSAGPGTQKYRREIEKDFSSRWSRLIEVSFTGTELKVERNDGLYQRIICQIFGR